MYNTMQDYNLPIYENVGIYMNLAISLLMHAQCEALNYPLEGVRVHVYVWGCIYPPRLAMGSKFSE